MSILRRLGQGLTTSIGFADTMARSRVDGKLWGDMSSVILYGGLEPKVIRCNLD
jgi:hypothetical protein